MKQKLLLKLCIPHSIQHGKSIRKLSNNYLLGGWQVYNDAHHAWLNSTKHTIHQAYSRNQFPHVNESKYRLSIGFYKGKSSKRFDISNFSLLLKWVEDVLVQVTPIPDDSYAYIVESRCVYLGPSESGDEECWVQLTKDDVEVDDDGKNV